MRIDELLKIIDKILPSKTAMDFDRLGLQIQSGREMINKLLIAYEVNDEVIKEAVDYNCDCIITFHPLLFKAVTAITDYDRVGRLCQQLIRKSIALISIHTNFDAFSKGTSKILADNLNFQTLGFLEPNPNYDGFGMGIIAKSDTPLDEATILQKVAAVCKSPLRYNPLPKGKFIETIGIVGGSGSSFISNALNAKCDCFITADVSYHYFHEVAGKMMLIDPGHYEMEQFVPLGLYNTLKETLNKTQNVVPIEIIVSNINTNPVKYFRGNFI